MQSPHPAAHTPALQELPEQAGATWFVEQALPQPPQFAALLVRSVSQPSLCWGCWGACSERRGHNGFAER